MQQVNRDWINKQLNKVISAEESLYRTERDHRESTSLPEMSQIYDRLIQDDEIHIRNLRKVAVRYGFKGGAMQAVGDMLGSIKSAVPGLDNQDPFQMVSDDLVMKSAALDACRIWTDILRSIGDEDSANLMQETAAGDEDHHRMLRDLAKVIGIRDATSQSDEERKAA